MAFPGESCRALQEGAAFPSSGVNWERQGSVLGGPAVLRGLQQEVSPSPGDTVNAGNCSKPVLTWTVGQPEPLSKPGLRSSLASEGQGQHKVSGHLLWDSVEVSQLTSHQLIPYSQMSLRQGRGKEAAGGCSPQPS